MIEALDPGGTTGWATWDGVHFSTGQLEARQHHLALWVNLNDREPRVLISERFEYRNVSRAGLVLDSREYIGVATLWCQMNASLLVMQSASQAKGFVKDENIKRLGLWVPGQPHAMDALRHLLYYLTTDQTPMAKSLLKHGWKE